jgi:hypothetical protein
MKKLLSTENKPSISAQAQQNPEVHRIFSLEAAKESAGL